MTYKIKKHRKKYQEREQTFSWKLNHDSNKDEFKYRLEVGNDVWYAKNEKEIKQFMKNPHVLWHGEVD